MSHPERSEGGMPEGMPPPGPWRRAYFVAVPWAAGTSATLLTFQASTPRRRTTRYRLVVTAPSES